MLDYEDILFPHEELVQHIVDYFTSETVNPQLFHEVKEIAIEWNKKSNNPNPEVFILLGYLSAHDFLIFAAKKNLIRNGIQSYIVQLVLDLLKERNIIIQDNLVSVGSGEKRYKANGDYSRYLYQKDLIFNLMFGFGFIIKKYKNSIFKIENIDKDRNISIGTGFLIQNFDYQLIVTNKHVLDNAHKINILDNTDKLINFEQPLLSLKTDLAIIPLAEKHDYPPFDLFPKIDILGDIITIGYPSIPMTKSAYQVCHKGEVNSFVEDYFGNKFFLISAKTSSGNSGSPVINKSGLVIGIITEELFEKDLFEKKGKLPYYAAISTEEILIFIEEFNNKNGG